MTDPDAPPSGSPAIRTIAMPADTNPAGDIFGGWLMSQMDLAGSSVASHTARGRTEESGNGPLSSFMSYSAEAGSIWATMNLKLDHHHHGPS